MNHLKQKSWVMTFVLCMALNGAITGSAAAQAPVGAPDGQPAGMGTPDNAVSEADSPVIDSVAVQGNRKLTTAVLMKDAAIKPGMKVSRSLVGNELERITALYKKAGYDLSISPDIAHPADGHVTITFKIDENGKGGDAGAAPGPAEGGPAPGGN